MKSSPLNGTPGINTAWDRSVARIELDLSQPKDSFRVANLERLDAALLAGCDFDEVVADEGRGLRRGFETADLEEGIRAFQQRRAAKFEGR